MGVSIWQSQLGYLSRRKLSTSAHATSPPSNGSPIFLLTANASREDLRSRFPYTKAMNDCPITAAEKSFSYTAGVRPVALAVAKTHKCACPQLRLYWSGGTTAQVAPNGCYKITPRFPHRSRLIVFAPMGVFTGAHEKNKMDPCGHTPPVGTKTINPNLYDNVAVVFFAFFLGYLHGCVRRHYNGTCGNVRTLFGHAQRH